jgi:hypothetical protein
MVMSPFLDFSYTGIMWNRTKMVSPETSSPNGGSILNKMGQTCWIGASKISVKSMSFYMGARMGAGDSYNVVAEMWTTDDDGLPATQLATASRPATDFTYEGWYFFQVDMSEMSVPSNRMLCFVVYQDGGSENDYVSWFYSPGQTKPNWKSIVTSDGGTTWTTHESATNTIRLLDGMDCLSMCYLDTPPHNVVTSPAYDVERHDNGGPYLSGGSGSGTMLVSASNETSGSSSSSSGTSNDSGDDPYITIDNRAALISFVVDSSGSEGWKDRNSKRKDIILKTVDLFKSRYPESVLFDMVNFGSFTVDDFDITSSSSYLGIRIDLNIPDSFQNNSDGSVPAITDGILAYGTYNLEPGHEYFISTISADQVVIEDGFGEIDFSLGVSKPVNHQSIGYSDTPILFDVAAGGPGSEKGEPTDAIRAVVPISGSTHLRKPIGSGRLLATTGLTSSMVSGDTILAVNQPSLFKTGKLVDVISAIKANVGLSVQTVTTVVSVTPAVTFNAGVATGPDGTFMQESANPVAIPAAATTMSILLKDKDATRPVMFYLQTAKGGRLEWEITALSEWVSEMSFFYDWSAEFTVSAFDSFGAPLSDGTEVRFYVDELPQGLNVGMVEEKAYEPLSPITIGTDVIQIDDVSDVSVGDLVTLYDGTTRVSGFHVTAVDTETNEITIFPPCYTDINITSVIVTKMPELEVADEPLCMTISAVDITPIMAGRNLEDDQLSEDDPVPVPPTPTDPRIYNQDEARRRDGTFSVPTIDGLAGIWILPITEDVVRTETAKGEAATNVLNPSPLTDSERAEVEALEEDYANLLNDLPTDTREEIDLVQEPPLEPVTTTGLDYIIKTPTYLSGGSTSTTMTTSSNTMTSTRLLSGYSFDVASPMGDRSALARTYNITPVIVIKDRHGKDRAAQILDSFACHFVSPYNIFSRVNKSIVIERCTFINSMTREEYDVDMVVPGTWTASDEITTIDYVVWDRNALMKNGTLKVRIFDVDRSANQMIEPWKFIPNFRTEICQKNGDGGPAFNLESLQGQFFNKTKDEMYEEGKSYISGITWQDATYIDGYSGEFSIPVVNGRASLSIKAPSTVVAKIMVMAEIIFPYDPKLSVIKQDPIWFKNPFGIVISGLGSLASGEDKPPYEIGGTLTWMGETLDVDNVEISFTGADHARFRQEQGQVPEDSEIAQNMATLAEQEDSQVADDLYSSSVVQSSRWPATRTSPSVSRTVAGHASGVFVGPHGLVRMHYTKLGELKGDTEPFTASASFGVFSASSTVDNEWIGYENENDFYFSISLHKNGVRIGQSAYLYADGWEEVGAVADIPASIDGGFPFVSQFEPYLLGEDRYGNPVGMGASKGQAKKCHFRATSGPSTFYSSPPWSKTLPVDPSSGRTIEGSSSVFDPGARGWAVSNPMYSSRAVEEPKDCDDPQGCCEPSCTKIFAETVTMIPDHEGGWVGHYGEGCASDNFTGCFIPSDDGPPVTRVLTVTWMEPLEATTSFYCIYGDNISRDGKNGTTIVTDVTFSGQPIPFLAKQRGVKDPTTGQDIPLPEVVFDGYYVHRTVDEDGRVLRERKYKDDTIQFSQSSVTLSLSMTTNDKDVNPGHYHDCNVDSSGNGVTTTTFEPNTRNVIPSTHIHIISDYVVGNAIDNTTEHSHSLRSVAMTQLLPINMIGDSLCITATVSYDASRDHIDRTITSTKCDDPETSGSEYITIDLDVQEMMMASRSVTEEASGLQAKAIVKRHLPNKTVVPIEDGRRIRFTLVPYPYVYTEETESGGVSTNLGMVTGQTASHKYIAVEIEASIEENGVVYSDSAVISVDSDLQWLPDVRALLADPTDDESEIESATGMIATLGSSQMHDAVILAATRMLAWQADNPEWRQSKKAIVLLTDGDENLSQQSFSQAINKVNSVNGIGGSPVMAFVNGIPNPIDMEIINRYVSETAGDSTIITTQTSSDLDETVGDMFSSTGTTNSGSYSNIIDIGSSLIPESIFVDSIIPSGGSVTISFRTGDDLGNMSGWSSPVDITGTSTVNLEDIGISGRGRYIEYQVVMNGNEYFESPAFYGVRTTYKEPKHHVIVFQPIYLNVPEDEYVNEVVISHHADIPETSEITYGIVQSDSLDDAAIFSAVRPVRTGGRTIMLSRSDEIMTSDNGVDFGLICGPWPTGMGIEVYRTSNGITSLVQPDEYTTDPLSGTVKFSVHQDSKAVLSAYILLPPILRIACRISNYSNDTVLLHNISVMYNTTKRIGRGGDGKILG